MPAKLWTLDDLKEYLGYEDTATAVEAIKEGGIPHLFPGRPDYTIEVRGAVRRVRFVPSAVEAWAVKAMKVHDRRPEPGAPSPEIAKPAVTVASGWRANLTGRAKSRAGQ